MWTIVYWEGGLLFMDRGGNMVSKIPSSALSRVKFKGRKIIIPYNGKKYVIVRFKMIMKGCPGDVAILPSCVIRIG